MATNSYHMAVRETKERLKGILIGPDSSLNWNDVESEFDRRVAEEKKKEVYQKKDSAKKEEVAQTSTSKASGAIP